MKTLIRRAVLFLTMIGLPIPSFAGPDQDLGDFTIFPDDNVWKWDISTYEVHPNSNNFIASVGEDTRLHPDFGTVWNGAPIGIPYVVVTSDQPLVPVVYTDYGDESDPGPFPIPLTAPVEGGASSTGDRHVIAVDKHRNILCELYRAFPRDAHWEASSGAKFDLTVNEDHPLGWTSADAAGLPIFPGLVRYEEVYIKQKVNHAIRMTVQHSQRAFIYPARHYASTSTDANHPPMGLRFRMKADYDISHFSPPAQIICRAMKKHGLIVADNGSDWFISGAPDPRWNDDTLAELKSVPGRAFEAVLTVDADGSPIRPQSIVAGASRRGTPIRSCGSVTIVNAGWDKHWRNRHRGTTFDLRGRRVVPAQRLSEPALVFVQAR